ncbi:MAG: UDP-4-amino-4,6-dideoxy-N-acetyl-beta-L-altrosamine transaminase [Elusimicrobia bacterium]|nr:UDP-4-amino-4,6-dideoxy-N-acetyl-beta-L-altrosamine transaminase [Elusimicrobiota bacterium]
MDFIPYGKQWLDKDDIEAVIGVLKSDFLTQGPAVENFEKKICEITGSRYCVAVANATAALHLAVTSLEIEKNREGITSPNTFLASANCLIYNNLKPVFADINPRTYNITAENIQKRISSKTSVIIPVHFAGQTCDMSAIKKLADENNLYVIEDAAHAIGSKYADGTMAGNCKYSDMTVFSFHPVKTITTGEGGAITTNNEKLYKRLLMLRNHGMTKDPALLAQNPGPWYYEMQCLGFNYRVTDMQSALGVSQLNKLDRFVQRRREIANKYNKAFENIDWLLRPYEENPGSSAFHLYVLEIDFEKLGITRKEVMERLQGNGIATQVHYIPVHTQPYYKSNFGYNWGDCPIAENYYQKALSLPLYPRMTDEDVAYVIKNVKNLGIKKTLI